MFYLKARYNLNMTYLLTPTNAAKLIKYPIIIPGTQIGLRSSSEDLSVSVEYFLLLFLLLVRNIDSRIKIKIMKMIARMIPEITPMLS